MGKFLDCANAVVLAKKAEHSSIEYDINDIHDKSQSMRVSEGFLQPTICDKRVSDLIRWRDCTPEQLQNLWARVKQGEPIQIYSDTLGEPVWWVRNEALADELRRQGRLNQRCFDRRYELPKSVDPVDPVDPPKQGQRVDPTVDPAVDPENPHGSKADGKKVNRVNGVDSLAISADPNSLENLHPYRIRLDDHAQLIWLEHGLTPEQVLRAAAEHYGRERVNLEPPPSGWPRLADIPELPASNPPPPESPCPACASTHWWQARGGGTWHCRHCDGADFDNQQDRTLTLPPAQPKTDATQPLDPDPDPDRALVCCRDCRRFELDQIGDGSGIGRCKAGCVARPGVDAPFYPLAPRRCNSFSSKEATPC